ncbi:hypothetical protein D3C74_440940 [compost metagenome]
MPWVLFGLLMALILSVGAVDIYGYQMTKSNLKTTVNESLQVMKVENGAGENFRKRFDELLRLNGIDPARVKVQATPQMVQRGDLVEITATIEDYYILILKAIKVPTKTQIRVHASGLAHKYIRGGE